MIIAFLITLAAFGLLFGTWLHYLAIMSLQRVRDAGALTPWARRFGTLLLGVGYLLDFLSNMLVLTVLMLEVPHELLVSARVTRIKHSGLGSSWLQRWRYNVACWACSQLLDPFDSSGCHCK
jgi:hypothetical protein